MPNSTRSRWLLWTFVTFLGLSFFYYTYQGLSRIVAKGHEPAVVIESPNQEGKEASAANSKDFVQNVAGLLPNYLNPSTAQGDQGTAATPGEGEFFAESRLERDRVRGQQIDLLQGMVKDPNSAQETRQEAQELMLEIGRNMEKEMETERLIMAKGFKDAVVFVQPEAVTVVVQAKTLSQEEVTRISDLVSRSTGCKLENMVIMPKE